MVYLNSRDVAQSGRAQRSGRWGRWFKSSRPDHSPPLLIIKTISGRCWTSGWLMSGWPGTARWRKWEPAVSEYSLASLIVKELLFFLFFSLTFISSLFYILNINKRSYVLVPEKPKDRNVYPQGKKGGRRSLYHLVLGRSKVTCQKRGNPAKAFRSQR